MGCILRHDSKYSIKSVFLRMIFRTGLNLVGGGLAMVPLVLIVVLIAGASPGDAAAAPSAEPADFFVLLS